MEGLSILIEKADFLNIHFNTCLEISFPQFKEKFTYLNHMFFYSHDVPSDQFHATILFGIALSLLLS